MGDIFLAVIIVYNDSSSHDVMLEFDGWLVSSPTRLKS